MSQPALASPHPRGESPPQRAIASVSSTERCDSIREARQHPAEGGGEIGGRRPIPDGA